MYRDIPPTPLACLALLLCIAPIHAAELGGEWVTDFGIVDLVVNGNSATGSYSEGGTIRGTFKGRQLELTYSAGNSSGSATLEFDSGGYSFSGSYKNGSNSGVWRGWRSDPKATTQRFDASGFWRTSYGLMELQHKGKTISGTYGCQGWNKVKGTIEGRRIELTWEAPTARGPAWIEFTADGKQLFGVGGEGEERWKWIGQRLEGYEKNPTPKRGSIVQGIAENNMTYYLRYPKKNIKGKPNCIVFLHGSNMTAKDYVNTLAAAWPKLAEDFILIGIDGEKWVDTSPPDSPRHNYTYVNWMGKSTYKGYPYTNRESPALVAEVVQEVAKTHALDRIFVGGHSQGGYLTFVLAMHYPKLFAGAFPMSCTVIMQAEPDVFDDAELLKSQRQTPIAIIHGENDSVVPFADGQYAYERFSESDFPMLCFFTHPSAAHMFARLPVEPAVRWLESCSSNSAKELEKFAKESLAKNDYRNATIAIRRAAEIGAGSKLRKIDKALDTQIKKSEKRWLQLLGESLKGKQDSSWIDEFLQWRDQFGYSPGAKKVMTAFAELRKLHEEPAEALRKEARSAFQGGNRALGFSKYEQIANKYYACSRYRSVKRWLSEQ